MVCDGAVACQVPAPLVCAIIEVSSQWNAALQEWEPEPWLLHSHPFDFPGGETEYLALGTRWGLMQFMGSRLKQAGWKGPLSQQLVEPKTNIEAGCCILHNCIGNGKANVRMVLNQWYGVERRGLVPATLGLLGTFERFVAERPLPAEKVPAG
jgi:Transglycosylase SLT domain